MDRISNAFTFSLFLLPISFLIFLIAGIFGLDSSRSYFEHFLSLSSILLFVVSLAFNWLFSFYSLTAFWSAFDLRTKLKYLLINLLTNGLAGYLYIFLWKKRGINVLSFKNKNHVGFFSILFYFCIFISVMVPLFAAKNMFP